MYANLIIDNEAQAVDRPFLYQIPDGLSVDIGDAVSVNFGTQKKKSNAYVMEMMDELPDDLDSKKIKSISDIIRKSVFTFKGLELINFLKKNYLCTYLDAIRLLIPKGDLKTKDHKTRLIVVPTKEPDISDKGFEKYNSIYTFINSHENKSMTRADLSGLGFSISTLNTMVKKGYLDIVSEIDQRYDDRLFKDDPEKRLFREQEEALESIINGNNTVYLLHGITGSGKTEIFLRAVSENLKKGHDSVILVPEIALTPQMIERVKGRFGPDITVYHSKLNDGERYDEWMRVKRGKVKIAIGARSALFLPFKDLRCVVIDEEHELSYKSETNPKYVTSQVAEFMMKQNGGKVILSSATPSIESYESALNGDYKLITINRRAEGAKLPKIRIKDMRAELR
ncbi:MAG: DEAD/DEAH box helicase, partial [Clostridiaceae bacterium]